MLQSQPGIQPNLRLLELLKDIYIPLIVEMSILDITKYIRNIR